MCQLSLELSHFVQLLTGQHGEHFDHIGFASDLSYMCESLHDKILAIAQVEISSNMYFYYVFVAVPGRNRKLFSRVF